MSKKRIAPIDGAIKKQIRVQNTANALALILSSLLLAFVFLFSTLSICSLENRLCPLIDEGLLAAHSEERERVCSIGEQIDALLKKYEPAMMIYANHKDITELLSCATTITALGANGERDDYIEALSVLRVALHYLKENNMVSWGNVL